MGIEARVGEGLGSGVPGVDALIQIGRYVTWARHNLPLE